MERWCAIDPEGRKLPEPLGDTEAELIDAFCALSEMSPEEFAVLGYTVGRMPISN